MRRSIFAAFALTFLAACQLNVGPLTEEDIISLNALRAAYRQGVMERTPDALSAEERSR